MYHYETKIRKVKRIDVVKKYQWIDVNNILFYWYCRNNSLQKNNSLIFLFQLVVCMALYVCQLYTSRKVLKYILCIKYKVYKSYQSLLQVLFHN